MIKRLVRLEFQEAFIQDFKFVYEKHLVYMKSLPSCQSLDFYNERGNPHIFFTISVWESEEALDNYRSSEYFRDIWGRIKPWFQAKPQAWTLDKCE